MCGVVIDAKIPKLSTLSLTGGVLSVIVIFMDEKKKSHFGLGLLIGALGGALVAKKFGKETKELYQKAVKEVQKRLESLRGKVDKIDKKKYQKLVDEVVSDLKKTTKHSARTLQSLKTNLVSDWNKLTSAKKTK